MGAPRGQPLEPCPLGAPRAFGGTTPQAPPSRCSCQEPFRALPSVRAHLRPGMCYVLVLAELQCICRINKMNVERVYRQQPLAWEPGPNGSGVDPWLVQEWVRCSCVSCTSMLQSWSGVEVEGAEWRQKGLEAVRGGQRRGREVIP